MIYGLSVLLFAMRLPRTNAAFSWSGFRPRCRPGRLRGPPLLSLQGLISLDATRASTIYAFDHLDCSRIMDAHLL
eukprot:13697697-Heterocapsa_arctica.AAC.1